MDLIDFSARVIAGSGRGKQLGTPTINVQMQDVPPNLEEGIYACIAAEGKDEPFLPAVLHYGPRPVFKDTPSCEVHFLNGVTSVLPAMLHIRIVARLREVRDFPSVPELQTQMNKDIADARHILERL